MHALDDATREFHGDSARTYLTGYSYGAKLGYELLAQNPRRFAAFVPVSGEVCVTCLASPTATPAVADSVVRAVVTRAGDVPMWIFHGDHDASVPVTSARHVADVRRAMGAPVKLTEFPNGGHDVWAQAYGTPELFPWLFAQRR